MKKQLLFVIWALLFIEFLCSGNSLVSNSGLYAGQKRRRRTYKTTGGQWYFKRTGVIFGEASFYGKKFHGRKTANGEIYNMFRMTAAHRTLPFGSLIRVTNLDNRKSVIVRINDRGPFVGKREIDLSYAAAKKIGFLIQGLARVKIEKLKLIRHVP